jgi:hypothetical protein
MFEFLAVKTKPSRLIGHNNLAFYCSVRKFRINRKEFFSFKKKIGGASKNVKTCRVPSLAANAQCTLYLKTDSLIVSAQSFVVG